MQTVASALVAQSRVVCGQMTRWVIGMHILPVHAWTTAVCHAAMHVARRVIAQDPDQPMAAQRKRLDGPDLTAYVATAAVLSTNSTASCSGSHQFRQRQLAVSQDSTVDAVCRAGAVCCAYARLSTLWELPSPQPVTLHALHCMTQGIAQPSHCVCSTVCMTSAPADMEPTYPT
eukprot:TRINITY_DN6992_c0_g1_i1.p1 TRINITY_DN6992_c0_g1~~TRINITY_DN6992_c0_g1_i1.p1  ORF type:complete len:174 (-),score=10.65 TRINITY_DN6992_c0_g1_i1:563-1084(-)